MSSPNIRDILAISKNKGDRRDWRNETNQSNRNAGTHPNSDRRYFHGPSIPCPSTSRLAHNHWGDGHHYVKAGVTREQVMAVMPAEIRQTVQLYLNGQIREWYSRGDGRGAVFLLDARDVAEAQTTMEGLPLAKQNLMDHEYIAVGPLLPIGLLAANPERRQ